MSHLLSDWIRHTNATMAAFSRTRVSINVVDVELDNRVDGALDLIPIFNCALKEMKNAWQKDCAARVPKEVFEEIMGHALRVAPVAVRVNGRSDLGWVKLSHICRSWRRLAIDYEHAWATSIGQLPLATDVFVERAGSSLLTAEMSGERPLLPNAALAYSPADEASGARVLRNLRFSRFKSVRVADGRVRACRFAMELCTQSMVDPLVHLAVLELEDLPWTLSREDTENLGRGVLTLHAPNLEKLRLKNCFFDFSCSNLRTLEVCFDGFSTPRPHTVAVVTALAGSPNIRSIKLFDAVSTNVLVDLTQPVPSSLVLLQSLDRLDVSGPALPLGDLLASLAFPPGTSIRVDGWIWAGTLSGSVRRITEALSDYLLQDFSTVAIDNDPQFGVEVTRIRMWVSGDISSVGYALRFGDSADGCAPVPRTDVTLRNHPRRRWARIVSRFMRKIKEDSVRSLAVSLPSYEYRGSAIARWIGVLDRFPALNELYPKGRILAGMESVRFHHSLMALVRSLNGGSVK
ncbi:hypothetical protein K488DRAFT_87707 [Vararia minispora EC-137]|uniref:Uncharacterized protein n=1 Tax=Vararia minispora EC-137 TaxID=1314806 RepID=A0ACB8QFI5_9AGAM|nr:hypothetical protein K488DRAFT_87707 [Vararia minispora EC-137]